MRVCPMCNVYYDISKDHINYLSSCIKDGKVKEAICVCPICGFKTIVGGEPDVYEVEEGKYEDCILQFSRDIIISNRTDVFIEPVFQGELKTKEGLPTKIAVYKK